MFFSMMNSSATFQKWYFSGPHSREDYSSLFGQYFHLQLQSDYHKMSYLLVVILELNSVSEVQYKEIMIIDNE